MNVSFNQWFVNKLFIPFKRHFEVLWIINLKQKQILKKWWANHKLSRLKKIKNQTKRDLNPYPSRRTLKRDLRILRHQSRTNLSTWTRQLRTNLRNKKTLEHILTTSSWVILQAKGRAIRVKAMMQMDGPEISIIRQAKWCVIWLNNLTTRISMETKANSILWNKNTKLNYASISLSRASAHWLSTANSRTVLMICDSPTM